MAAWSRILLSSRAEHLKCWLLLRLLLRFGHGLYSRLDHSAYFLERVCCRALLIDQHQAWMHASNFQLLTALAISHRRKRSSLPPDRSHSHLDQMRLTTACVRARRHSPSILHLQTYKHHGAVPDQDTNFYRRLPSWSASEHKAFASDLADQ